MPPTELEYSLRPDARAVVHNADSVELRTGVWNSNVVTLTDDEHRGILADIVVGLVHGDSTTDITARVGASPADLQNVIETLADNDFVAVGKPPSGWSLTTLATNRTVGMTREARKRPTEVLLISPERLNSLFRSALSKDHLDRVRVISEDVWQPLSRQDLFLDRDAYATVEELAGFDDWRGKAIVSVLPVLEPILLGNLNRIAHAVEAILLAAVVDGPFGIIGPTVVPKITPCFQCAETRVLDAMRDHTLYVNYRSALAEGRVHPVGAGQDHPFEAVITSLAAWETANLLALGSGFTAGKLMTLYAPTMEVSFHELLRVPGCPACGHDIALDAPLYADLRAYISTEVDTRGRR